MSSRVIVIAALLTGFFRAAHALQAQSGSTDAYYVLRPDARRCGSPWCGAAYIKRINGGAMRCADGRTSAECHVASVDWSALKLREWQGAATESVFVYGYALVRGEASKGRASFTVRELWQPRGEGAPLGAWYRVRDSGIRCVTTPCFALRADRLDGAEGASLSALDLDALEVSDFVKLRAMRGLAHGALIVTGTVRDNRRMRGPTAGLELVATQIFERVQP